MYVPALTTHPAYSRSTELVAVVDMDLARVEAFKELRGLDLAAYRPDEFDRMIAETAPDVVIIATPDGTHVDFIVQSLAHGLDVITEKPMVIDCDQANRIFAAEAASDGSVRVTHNTRYTAANRQIKRMILDGLVGRVTNVEFVWNIDTYHGSSYFYRWNRDRAKSGGMSITKGCHHFDLLNWWMGDVPEQVFAFGALNYYGSKSPWNPSVIDGKAYPVREQRERSAYRTRWLTADAPPEDDHLKPGDPGYTLPNEAQYPSDQPLYIFDAEIDIEDTYSAVIRYRGGASATYSTNFSAPWEGYTVAVNGTHGRLESTHHAAPSRTPFPVTGEQSISYFPMFGERQIHETRKAAGGHGGSDPLLLRHLFTGELAEDGDLGLAAGSLDGAYAVAVGEAVWRSARENRLIAIDELLVANGNPYEKETNDL
ncbi:MAG: Gfo/Idh/MocA family oxidoreductase [Chloroflexia bacterium]|nr:Gfo/Idh/MocA family oxidoreductase [Chloroflexia bacterium]